MNNKPFKTKDQKLIAKLESELVETKKELTQVKKDRKRLNYEIERLKREGTKYSLISEHETSVVEMQCKKIKELEADIEKYKESYPELEKRIENLRKWNESLESDKEELRKIVNNGFYLSEIAVTDKIIKDIIKHSEYGRSKEEYDAKIQFDNGGKYFCEENVKLFDLKEFNYYVSDCLIFSCDTLIIRINPNDGRYIHDFFYRYLHE